MKGMRHIAVLVLGGVLLALALSACGRGPSEVDIEATVLARIEEKQAKDAALEAEARAKANAMVEAAAQAAPVAASSHTLKLPSTPTTDAPSRTPSPPPTSLEHLQKG